MIFNVCYDIMQIEKGNRVMSCQKGMCMIKIEEPLADYIDKCKRYSRDDLTSDVDRAFFAGIDFFRGFLGNSWIFEEPEECEDILDRIRHECGRQAIEGALEEFKILENMELHRRIEKAQQETADKEEHKK